MAKQKEQDALNEALNQSEAFFIKYKKVIISVLAALFLLIAGVICYQMFIAGPRENKASTALGAAQELFANEQFQQALEGDSTGVAGFVKVASDYKGTKAANLANLYAGLCYAKLEKWEDAVKFLEKFSPADDAMISPAAVEALGNAYAHVKKLDKAVNYLLKAADKADKRGKDGVNLSLSPMFRLQAAEILESQGKKDEALKIYKEIKEKYTASGIVQSQEIDKYIERLSIK